MATTPPLAFKFHVPAIGMVGVPEAIVTLPADSTDTIKDVTKICEPATAALKVPVAVPVNVDDPTNSSPCRRPISKTVPTEIVPIPKAVIVPPLTRVIVPAARLATEVTVPAARLVIDAKVPVKSESNPLAPTFNLTLGKYTEDTSSAATVMPVP